MSPHDHLFHSVWTVAAAPARVMGVLTDLANYPVWWPDVRSVRRVDDDTADVMCRAVLPYRLALRLRREQQDEVGGRLRLGITGDLDGYCAARVHPDGVGTRLVIEQRVEVRRPLLRALAPVARPLLRANHAAMMWRGRRRLNRYLASSAAAADRGAGSGSGSADSDTAG